MTSMMPSAKRSESRRVSLGVLAAQGTGRADRSASSSGKGNSPRDAAAPDREVVEVRGQGGVVSVAQVCSDFEGKLGRKLTDRELAETVDHELQRDRAHAGG
ncbi:hypothetical protein [Streptomyces sp. S.PB5]|uniref:hypothetical protein n=1 Tax=Streptomyces sp. S.PB5 TaxID=3020844 RepID=UPI0025AED3C1|nr:hypothetical protein [Streptomyces sp. S.PB5]MDN3028197.1 hypothetical protein [Streptomyces sp. S.PB5]